MSQSSIKNILIPTDFSELSQNALNTAVAICNRQNATLHVLHVVENRIMITPPESIKTAIYVIPELEKAGSENLATLKRKLLKKNKINIQTYMEYGNPADSIRDKAIELHCELIVMGTHGTSGFREFFIGSNAYNVIKNTTIPVLTIPGKKKVKEFTKILFPIRATKGIMEKYDFIEPIINKNNAEIFIAGLSLPGEEYKLSPMDEEIRELGKALRMNNTQFKSENFVCKNYAKKVLELSRKEKVNLIVINASLDYNWQQFFVGPYTQQVVNHSRVPVLSIRNLKAEIALVEKIKDHK